MVMKDHIPKQVFLKYTTIKWLCQEFKQLIL